MTQQTYDANAVLMGGGGPKGWSFADPGTTRTGTIAEPPQAKQERDYDPNNPGGGSPKFFPSGDPIMGIHVVVQTNERDATIEGDDGRRTFYIEGRYLKEAVREGIRNAGSAGLEVGGQLTVTFTHREDPNDKRSRKYWSVQYVPAGNAALMGEQQPQQALQQSYQQQAPAYQPPAAPQGYAPPQAASAPAQQPVAPPVQQAPAQAAAAAPIDPQLAAFQAWQASQQAPQQQAG
ncbi:hypothetical protein [Phycicoccus jejuensis]|uniref:hypothetical protein n=1 Tax=Phycicoccus jejuensis TaxID=367299 RepID=UPI000691327D|nr:hypothetical protein [Phycicoccus jejuensis]